MISPDSSVATIWRRLNAVTASVSLYLVSTCMAFMPTHPAVLAAIYSLDVLYAADIYWRWRVVAVKRKGDLVRDRRSLLTHCFDLVAILPVELIPLGAQLARGDALDIALQTAAYYRVGRILRVYRTYSSLSYEERSLNSNSSLIQIMKSTLLVCVLVHLQACIWYRLACDSLTRKCGHDSWTSYLDFYFEPNITSLGNQYVVALYWAVATSTSTGYGDIRALMTNEKWFASFSMLAGIALFGFILGGLASRLTNADSVRFRYTHLFDTVRDYLFDNAVTEDVSSQVKEYYMYTWNEKKGVNSKEMFTELPHTFRADLSLAFNRIMIDKASLFDETGDAFRRMLALRVKKASYLPGQMVLRRGDLGVEMQFLHRGSLEVLDTVDKEPTEILHPGVLFGEMNLLYSLPRTASVRALTHCDLLTLSKSDLTKVLKHFPDVAGTLRSAAERRLSHAANEIASFSNKPVVLRTKRAVESLSALRRMHNWWKSLVIMPNSRFVYYWDRLVVFLTFIFTIIYPFEAAFGSFKTRHGYDSGQHINQVVFVFLYLMDCVYIVDIFVSFKKAGSDKEESTGDRILKAAGFRQYIISVWFALDLLSIAPVEFLSLAWDRLFDRWRLVHYFRLNRMIRWYKIPLFFGRLESDLNESIALVRVVKFLLYIVTASHVVCCVWFLAACPLRECFSGSWAIRMGITNESALGSDYILSLYWAAATMSSTGYGDVRAHLPGERVYALLAMMVGLLLYGYCLSTIAATSANAASAKVAFHEKMTAVREFMGDHSLKQGLISRAQEYFSLVWRQNRGLAVPGKRRLMDGIPVALQQSVALQETRTLFDKVPLFRNCDVSFMKDLSLVTHSFMFSPGEYVVYSGDIGREMYMVKRGIVEVMSEDLKRVVCTIEPGGYFGEIGLMFAEARTATIRTATYCELLVIDRGDLNRVLSDHPIVGRQFSSFTSNRSHLKEIQRTAAALTTAADRGSGTSAAKNTTVVSALASILSVPLGPLTRTQLATTVAASIPNITDRQQVAVATTTLFSNEGTFRHCSRISKTRRRRTGLDIASSAPAAASSPLTATGTPKSVLDTGITLTVDRPQERRRALSLSLPSWTSGSRPSRLSSLIRGNGITPQVGGLYAVQDDETLTKRPRLLSRLCSYFLMPIVILPSSSFCKVWEIISILASAAVTITVSLQAGFLYDNSALWGINYILDVFFLVDMYLKFHLAYYNEFSVLVHEPFSCARNYIRSNFILDSISSLPLEVFAAIAESKHALATLALLRLNRLVRIYKLYQGFDYLESDLGKSTGMITIRFIKFLVYLIISTHWTACAWFLIGTVTDRVPYEGRSFQSSNVWLNQRPLALGNSTVGRQYIVSLYWAASTTASVGYGDIRAHTSFERVFALTVMVLGIVCYGYVVASVAAALANADAQRARYREKLDAIRTFMDDQDLHMDLRSRIMNFYEYLWEVNKGVNFKSLFDGMPQTLQSDITLSLYKRILDEVPLFQNTELGFAKLLSMSIKPIYFLAGEYVVRKGDVGSEMFFIHRGTVEVVSEDGEVVFAKMNAGQFFGEISLVYSVPRTASIRAATNCDIFVLAKRDLDDVLSHYPHIERQINAVAEQRRQNVRKRSEATASAQAAGASAAAAAKKAAEATREKENKEEKNLPPCPSDAEHSSAVEIEASSHSSDFRSCCRSRMTRFFAEFLPETCHRLTFWNAFTFVPSNRMWRAITVTTAVLSFLTFFTITYQAAFQDHSTAFWVLNNLFEIIFLVEFYLSFHLAYDDHGAMICDFGKTARRYLHGDFFWDIVPLLPNVCVFLLAGTRNSNLLRTVYSYVQLIRVVRVRKVLAYFDRQSSNLNAPVFLVRISKFFITILISTHGVACILYLLACQTPEKCGADTWMTDLMNMARKNNTTMVLAVRYCNSIYWTVATMTSTGYGDLYARTDYEKAIISVIMVVGKLLFGFVLGSITSTLANADSQKVQYDEKVQAVKKYMNGEKLSWRLQRKVLSYYEYIWERNKGVVTKNLFDDLPLCMKAELFVTMAEPILNKVPFFAGSSIAFMRNLAIKLTPVLFLSTDCIARQGDVLQYMVCLTRGDVEEIDESDGNERVIRTLRQGAFFSEEALANVGASRFTYKAVTPVDCLILEKSDLDSVLVHYPEIAAKVRECCSEQ